MSFVLGRMCVQPQVNISLPPKNHVLREEVYPAEFDACLKWPKCPTISEVSDQGACGWCWVFTAVETMSDRVCIHSNSQVFAHISANDLVSCCTACGSGCRAAIRRKLGSTGWTRVSSVAVHTAQMRAADRTRLRPASTTWTAPDQSAAKN